MKWYFKVWKDYAIFSGRARRREFWMFTLFDSILTFAVILIGALILNREINARYYYSGPSGFVKTLGILLILYRLVIFIPLLAVTIRRLYDTNRRATWLLLPFIPVVGQIWFILLMLEEGTLETNRYGADPKRCFLPERLNNKNVYLRDAFGKSSFDDKSTASKTKETANLIRSSAERGHTIAQYNLGNYYCMVDGVERNLGEAAKWYRLAAEQGLPEAQRELGVCYLEGVGFVKDYEESYFWLSLASTSENEIAMRLRAKVEEKLSQDVQVRIREKAKLWLEDFNKKRESI